MLALLTTTLVLAFPALVLTAAASDAISFTIPNWIPLGLLAVFPLAALATGLPLHAIGLHFALAAGVLVIGMVLFATRVLGGGDAKLIAAVALWLGWPSSVTFLLVAGLAGGVLAVTLLAMRSPAVLPVVLLGPRWFARLADKEQGVPYAVAIAVGALAAFGASPLATGL
jgi:prepilin peptidase CpaA